MSFYDVYNSDNGLLFSLHLMFFIIPIFFFLISYKIICILYILSRRGPQKKMTPKCLREVTNSNLQSWNFKEGSSICIISSYEINCFSFGKIIQEPLAGPSFEILMSLKYIYNVSQLNLYRYSISFTFIGCRMLKTCI